MEGLTIKKSWENGVNTISINDYSIELFQEGKRMKVGPYTFDINEQQTINILKDGTVSFNPVQKRDD